MARFTPDTAAMYADEVAKKAERTPGYCWVAPKPSETSEDYCVRERLNRLRYYEIRAKTLYRAVKAGWPGVTLQSSLDVDPWDGAPDPIGDFLRAERDSHAVVCVYCGQLGGRHEYHHHRGYDAEYHLDVVPLCTKCHHAEDNANAAKTHCVKGHLYTRETTGYHADGRRHCLACRRERDACRRDAAWWRAYRTRRKERQGG